MNKCDSYDYGFCRRERTSVCGCKGYEERCDFFEYVRERGRKALKEENDKMRRESWHYCPYCGKELK